MSSNTIDATLITQFSDTVHVKSQQMKARLRPHVTVVPMVGDEIAYDGLNAVEAREITGRFAPAVFDDITHTRRKIPRRRFVVNLPIDASDVRGRLSDPQGDYAAACVRAMERQFDRIGVEAAVADVLTGRNFGTTVTYATDGGLTVNATAGATYETLLEARKNWTNNEVDMDMEESILLLMTGTEEEAFLQELELTSGDFTRQAVVDQGKIAKAVGFNFITYGADVSNPILDVNSGTRDCLALTGRSLRYGMSKEMSIKVQERSDLIETTQVQIIAELGAVRTEGLLVQKFQTTA